MNTRRQRLLFIGLCVAVMVAAGQFMERGQPRPERDLAAAPSYGAGPTLSSFVPVIARMSAVPVSGAAQPLPPLPQDPATSGGLQPLPARLAAGHADDASAWLRPDMPEFGVSGLPCGPVLDAVATGAATVRLSLSAPCHPGSRVTLHHDLVSFTEVTGQLGLLSVEVPALSASAAFVLELEDGPTLTRAVSVPAADRMNRAALVADGGSGMQLHAYEAGARFGEAGHVWADMPRGIGARGTLRTLGDPALPGGRMAQVYTAPVGTAAPRLSVEVAVTAANCGREIEARTVLPDANGKLGMGVVSFAVPGCDAVGEFLVLKNLPAGRKLAAN